MSNPNSFLSLFRPMTATDLISRQRRKAEKSYIEHLAAAETHQMLANAYKQRLARLTHTEREIKTGTPVELIDPRHALGG